jgi:hypothetical protein
MSTAASAPKPRTRSAQAPETEASDRCQDPFRPWLNDAADLPGGDRSGLELIVRESAGDAAVADLRWLTDYDDYYCDRTRTRPLPVLRAEYADREQTWMYLDPSRGAIALVTRQPDRMNRWLYHGLHSFDFSWLRNRRPLWDTVLILLSIGGIAGSATSLVPTCRRLRRHCRSMFALAGAPAPARAAQVDAALTTSQTRSSDTQ